MPWLGILARTLFLCWCALGVYIFAVFAACLVAAAARQEAAEAAFQIALGLFLASGVLCFAGRGDPGPEEDTFDKFIYWIVPTGVAVAFSVWAVLTWGMDVALVVAKGMRVVP